MTSPPPDQIIRQLQKGNLSVHVFNFRNRITRELEDPESLDLTVTHAGGSPTTFSYAGSDTAVWTRRSRGTYTAEVTHDTVGTTIVKCAASNPTVVFVSHVVVIDASV